MIRLKMRSRQKQKLAEAKQFLLEMALTFIDVTPAQIDNLIKESLQSVNDFSGGDRCYIYLFTHNNRQLDLSHEYSRDNIPPKIPRHERIDHGDFAWLVTPLLDNKPVHHHIRV